MISILIAGTLLGQWKGWDGAAGQPAPGGSATKTMRIDRPAGAIPRKEGIGAIEPRPRQPEPFATVPIRQRTTPELTMQLAMLRQRAIELQYDLERNAMFFRNIPGPAPSRGRLRSTPMAAPAAQAARYLSLHKRMRHQWNLLIAEIGEIEDELRRRGVHV